MIQIERIPPATIHHEWSWMRPLLEPAIRHDKLKTVPQVWRALCTHRMDAWVVNGEAQGLIVTSEAEGDFWINYCGGFVNGGPHQRVAIMRVIADHFETIAKDLGLAGVRVGGRDWSRVLTDYTPVTPGTTDMRKAI